MSDTENKLVDQTESIQLDDDQEPKRRSNVLSNQNSTADQDRDLVAPSQRKNRTQSVCYNTNDAFKSPMTMISKNSLNSLRRNRDENEGRELRCSNARINLQENNNEVVYASGRKSKVVKTLETMAKRVSVMENIGDTALRQSYLQNLTSSGNLLGENSKLNNVASLSPLAEVNYNLTNAEEYEQKVEDLDDQYFNNYRRGSDEQENLHRISSVISNKSERLSRELNRKDSTFSNEDMIKERANNPQARKRPTSAGLQSKNSRYSRADYTGYDFENRCLSDTELDTMEIELANDFDGPQDWLTNQLII